MSRILFTGGDLPQCMLGYHTPPPPGTRHPPKQTSPCAVGDRSTSGWYISYWNAILFRIACEPSLTYDIISTKLKTEPNMLCFLCFVTFRQYETYFSPCIEEKGGFTYGSDYTGVIVSSVQYITMYIMYEVEIKSESVSILRARLHSALCTQCIQAVLLTRCTSLLHTDFLRNPQTSAKLWIISR